MFKDSHVYNIKTGEFKPLTFKGADMGNTESPTLTLVDDRVYFCGGTFSLTTGTAYCLNLLTLEWRIVNGVKIKRYYHTAGLIDKIIYFYGGLNVRFKTIKSI